MRAPVALAAAAAALAAAAPASAQQPAAGIAKAKFVNGAAHPARGGGAVVQWRTRRERGNVGFILYRAREAAPHKRARLLPQMVAGTVLDIGKTRTFTFRRTYRHYDPDGHRGDRYFVRSVDVKGHTKLHGPYVVRGATVRHRKDSPLLVSKTPTSPQTQVPTSPGATLPVQTQPVVEPGPPVPTVTPAPTIAPTTTAGPTGVQTTLASRQTVRLGVDRTGWTRVDLSIIKDRGVDTSIPANLHLYTGGHEIPALIRDGGLEFYGQAVDTLDTATRAYFVEAQTGPGLRIDSAPSGTASSGPDSFTTTAVTDNRSVYFSGLRDGGASNFFGAVVSGAGTSVTVNTPHVDSPTKDAAVTITLRGLTKTDHAIGVLFNGDSVGTMSFSGQSRLTKTFSVPGVGEGQNTVRLVPSGSGDLALTGPIAVQYDHAMTADGDRLTPTVPGGKTVQIGGFSQSGVRVMDITDPEHPIALTTSTSNGSVSVTAPGSGSRQLLAFAPGQVQGPAVETGRPSTLHNSENAGALTIITPPAYAAALQPLVDQRRAEGLSVAVVGLQDIYDEYSFGQADHAAITAFLNDARATWHDPPRYVLLGGDGTYDPRGFQGRGTDGNVVPVQLIDTSDSETASDSMLTGTLATGRFPARTPAQMAALVSKTLAYGAQPSTGSALLVSDVDDTWDFSNSSAALHPLLPSSWSVKDVQRGNSGARADVLAGLNAGPSVVNYAGHGSVDLWRGDLLTDDDPPGLTNAGKLSFDVFMTCLNGYFIDPTLDALAEALIKAPNGAVAVFSSTASTTPGPQESANQALFAALFGGSSSPRLGDAVISSLSAAGDPDVQRTWTLIGDPTLVIH